MLNRDRHEQAVRDAVASQDRARIWTAYQAAWNDAVTPAMSADVFRDLFYHGDIARAASQLAEDNQSARQTLRNAALQVPRLDDGDVRSVVRSVVTADELVEAWERRRRRRPVEDRLQQTRALVTGLIDWMGREWVRDRALSWWSHRDVVEEEREALFDALSSGRALDAPLLTALGPVAQALARQRGLPASPGAPLSLPGTTPQVSARLASLLQAARIALDLRDGRLSPEEHARIASPTAGMTGLLQALRHEHPMWEDLAHALERAQRHGKPVPWLLPPVTAGYPQAESGTFVAPLLRVLHMRLVLEAPALAGATARPQDHLVPEVLLYVLGREAATYAPELRVRRDCERRWRAHWAEVSGEAFAVMLLEDALSLDLPTLTRIPEQVDQRTPDFMAKTLAGELLVFEAKGATHWQTHRRQRGEALRQLAKARSGGHSSEAWAGEGRAFACCLFAALEGSQRSSLLHLADPPTGFGHLFHEGWESRARQQHYAAVAEAAGLFDLADRLLHRSRERENAREVDTFTLDWRGGEAQFRGTRVDMAEMAQRLRHPRPDVFERVRVFTGVEAGVYAALQRGDTRGLAEAKATGGLLPGAGALPAASGARGVYSLLSDGAFVAIEVA